MLALVYSFFIHKRKLEIVTMLLIRLKEWGRGVGTQLTPSG